MAASVVFNHNDGVYAIDSDPTKVEETEKNILTWMGTLLEKYLTMNTEEFLAYMRTQPRLVIEDEKVTDEETREAYRYSKSNKFVMRSQLDCHDSRLPGTGVFDIKTRACMPIRMDILNFEESSGYLITKQQGLLQSFEREYYDLIRSAFLKYSFQARIGNMDGVFVAYHNTARMFGFQYVPLEEMDQRLFSEVPGVGDRVFQKCVELLEVVVDEIIACFPGQSVKCTFETRQAGKDMDVWVEPAEWDRLDKPKPIKQLCVNARSFLGNTPVKGDVAVRGAHETWTLHWTVTHMHASEETVRQNLKRAKERQFRAYTLPTGIDHSQIEDWWNGLNFSGKPLPESVVQSSQESIKNETESPAASDSLETKPNDSVPMEKDAQFFSDNFTEPDKGILALRRIARRGREISQQLAEEEKGKPKIVLGVGEVYVDESIWDRVDDKADNVVGSQSS
ncbi:hypothetical protein VNI00_002441 [Paramarasmius palmivorus]|uniref:Pet127-domain-containing protein n=1 Tax=Paramarasmius palmivorus TaxID=297713 RepID=A0AAW0DV71_9AGAR